MAAILPAQFFNAFSDFVHALLGRRHSGVEELRQFSHGWAMLHPEHEHVKSATAATTRWNLGF